ncbi:MAG: response regulator [Angelakisella sp.]
MLNNQSEITKQAFINEFQYQLDLYRASNIGGVYTVRMDDQFTLLYGNDLYFQLHEFEPKDLLGKSCGIFIHPKDLEHVHSVLANARKENIKNVEWEMRIITGKKNLKYTLVSGSFNFRGGEEVFDGYITDITKLKEMERRVRESEEKFRIATKNSDFAFWTYYFKGKEIHQTEASRRIHGHDMVVHNIPQSLIDSGYLHQDSIEEFLEMYRKLESGEKNVSGVFWFKNLNDDGWWCESIHYTTVFDENGKPVCAHAVGKDVTAEKNAESLYNEELAYKNAIVSQDFIGSMRANLSTGQVEEIASPHSWFKPLYLGKTFDKCVGTLGACLIDEQQRMDFLAALQYDVLIRDFKNGISQKNFHVQRVMADGTCKWTSVSAKLFKKPNSNHIVIFLYSYDIDREVMFKQAMEKIAHSNYDMIGCIDGINNTYTLFSDMGEMSKSNTKNYEQAITTFLTGYTSDPLLLEGVMLSAIFQALESKDMYSLEFTFKDDTGKTKSKQLRFSYIDSRIKTILFTESDFTEVVNKEEAQQEILHAALIAAEQANAAKSDFLSRMSHEIRTPMNAIIGMSAIAAQSIGNDAQVSDCISKIGISSRFLLSLINDILDMSRIESGKMLLKNEKIPFEEFINGVNSICYNQAHSKNIDYECVVDLNIEDYYIGDAMKLQQVLINILSNAIKFTEDGGKVSFSASQRKKSKNDAILRFVINDTGCGMSEEFIPHLFEAFSQEHTGRTTLYGGTGLGLAICKNIVDMMDGKIDVRSIKGVGTEFTIEVRLGISDETRIRHAKKHNYNFSQLKTLVVDDDVTVCEHAIITLKDMGIMAEWVDSGIKAVNRVEEKWSRKEYFDMILIDWKMPGMDGIETAKRIRKIVGPDVTIIIMTAFDWASIEHEAKLAGVNLLMSKPMFKSSLISAFEKALGEKDEDENNQMPSNFDFTGKRLLLAEDHPLNVEVATKLLQKKGFTIEHAENGLKAMEMYSKAPVGYYDGILMDIRMPIMDGLQASHNIRHLSNEDAKTIPIIAMTANAFEDDMDKSKQAGMNAHLAKPIDPKTLYQTLYDFIYDKDKKVGGGNG